MIRHSIDENVLRIAIVMQTETTERASPLSVYFVMDANKNEIILVIHASFYHKNLAYNLYDKKLLLLKILRRTIRGN
jgi:hypothetical protein